jgi:hypothetical protein
MMTAVEAARAAGVVASGNQIVVLAGAPDAGPGHTNALRLVET